MPIPPSTGNPDERAALPGEVSALVARASRGDEDAWADLIARYARRVYALARARSFSPDDAEEITQSVFVTIASKLRSCRLRRTRVVRAVAVPDRRQPRATPPEASARRRRWIAFATAPMPGRAPRARLRRARSRGQRAERWSARRAGPRDHRTASPLRHELQGDRRDARAAHGHRPRQTPPRAAETSETRSRRPTPHAAEASMTDHTTNQDTFAATPRSTRSGTRWRDERNLSANPIPASSRASCERLASRSRRAPNCVSSRVRPRKRFRGEPPRRGRRWSRSPPESRWR